MSEKDFPKYNQEDAEENNFNNDEMDASEKTVFISRPTNNVVDEDKTVIQSTPPQYSGYTQPEEDATVINMSKNDFIPPVDNDATVFLNKPNFSTPQADDATVFLSKPNIPTSQADDATVFLSKPNFSTPQVDDATVFLDKPNIPKNKTDDSTVILPRQSQPVYQTPRREEGDDAATVISQPTPRYKQEEAPIAQPPKESTFSKHKTKFLIGIAGLLGLTFGTYIVTQSKPTVVVKQEVLQPATPPPSTVIEPPPATPALTPAPVENTPTPTVATTPAPQPAVSTVKKNLPKPPVSKPKPTTTYTPATQPVIITQTKAESPKVIVEDQPDVPLKPVVESKPTGPKTYQVNELSQLPEFPEVETYLKRNVKYPDEAKRNKIKGSVFVAATIETDGRVVGARLLKGLGSGCDEAALEVVRKMPKWKAGKANGQNVRSEVSVKVPFQ
jgi:periplasmic protein TonB